MDHTKGTIDPDTGRARVYGGNPDLVHIKDGTRRDMGATLAAFYDATVRALARARNAQALGRACPGCYMVAVYNCAVSLADDNGQSRSELAETLSAQFAVLASHPEIGMIEEIDVMPGRRGT